MRGNSISLCTPNPVSNMDNEDQENTASVHDESEEEKTAASEVHTGGGVYVAGNVATSGDFIGRDKIVHGDEIRGNKVTIQQVLSETDIQDQNNRRTLRQMVRKYWINDYLENSLNHEAAIRLNL